MPAPSMWCLWASPRAPPGTMQGIFTGAVVQQSGLLTASSLLASSCTAGSFPACKPYGSLTPIRTGGKERPADQRAKTTLNTAAGGKHSEVALPETKKDKAPTACLSHEASYMACLFFFVVNRNISTNRIWQECTLYSLNECVCAACVSSGKWPDSSLLIATVEDKIKSPKSWNDFLNGIWYNFYSFNFFFLSGTLRELHALRLTILPSGQF